MGEYPVDMVRFVEGEGGMGVEFPAVNLTAWRVEDMGFWMQDV